MVLDLAGTQGKLRSHRLRVSLCYTCLEAVLRLIDMDRTLFMMAFGRDVDHHDEYSQLTYLDRRTGDVVWLCECDNDTYREAGIPAVDTGR